MVRVKCSVSYDGSKFHGFQVQNKLRTVQGEIQKALKIYAKKRLLFMVQEEPMQRFMELNKFFILILQEKCLKRSGNGQLIIFYQMIYIS